MRDGTALARGTSSGTGQSDVATELKTDLRFFFLKILKSNVSKMTAV